MSKIKNIKRIRTTHGDLPVDYESLDNLPTFKSINGESVLGEGNISVIVDTSAIEEDLSNLETRVNNIPVINEYIKSISYEQGSGIFRFIKQDGSIQNVDTAIEKVVTNFQYNNDNQTLSILLADGTVQSVPISDFIKEYSESENEQIQVVISSGNKIEVILKNNSITSDFIDTEIMNKINTTASKVDNLESVNPSLSTGISELNTKINTTITNVENLTSRVSTNETELDNIKVALRKIETPIFSSEIVSVDSNSWIEIPDSDFYTYETEVVLQNLTSESVSVELINNNPILFSNYGFAISEIVSNNKIKIIAIELPEEAVSLKIEVCNMKKDYIE